MNVTPTHPMLDSYYSQDLVFFSILVAVLASYTALTMTSRVSQSRGRAAVLWLAGGAFAMGLGIWSMHFIGMLAFNLPIALGYDLTLTGLSLVAAIGSSAFALWLVSRPQLPWHQILFGAVLMGAGIATMHYIGMAAMKIEPGIHYQAGLFILSILIAVLASGSRANLSKDPSEPMQTMAGFIAQAGSGDVPTGSIDKMPPRSTTTSPSSPSASFSGFKSLSRSPDSLI